MKNSTDIPKDVAPLLYLRANGRLHDLLQLAKTGDREAASYLLSVLTDNVENFLNLCSQKPNLALEIWRPGQPWPLLHTQLRRNGKGCLALPRDHVLRKIGIIPRRTFSKEATTTGVAIHLYYDMDFYRRMGLQQGEGGEPLRPLVIKKSTRRKGRCDCQAKRNGE